MIQNEKDHYKYNRCCRCEAHITTNDIFSFRRCLNTHGRWAHRICPTCWWNHVVPESENIHFVCFGCQRKWPLWYIPKEKPKKRQTAQIIQVID